MRFLISDAGRILSCRPKQRNDCTVRALALTRGLSYDEAYDQLKAAGRKCSRGFHLTRWLLKQPWARYISFPAVKGQRRMTPKRFTQQYPSGRYILRAAHHVLVVMDGVAIDAVPVRADCCIYCAFEVQRHDL